MFQKWQGAKCTYRNVTSVVFSSPRQLHDAQNQIGSLKRSQQADRKKNTQMLDEARQRADTIQNDAEMLKVNQ